MELLLNIGTMFYPYILIFKLIIVFLFGNMIGRKIFQVYKFRSLQSIKILVLWTIGLILSIYVLFGVSGNVITYINYNSEISPLEQQLKFKNYKFNIKEGENNGIGKKPEVLKRQYDDGAEKESKEANDYIKEALERNKKE